MSLFNTRILEASIRDVFVHLSDMQTTDVLLYALQHLPMQGFRIVMENAVQSILQVPNLPSTYVATALLLRAKRRLAEGYCTTAQKDLQSALTVDPENQDIKAVIRSQSLRPEISLKDPDCPPCFSAEIWWQIAFFLPKRDLKSLLFVSNAFSGIARHLLFRDIDLHLTTATQPARTEGQSETVPGEIVDPDIDAWNNQRNADILTRILVDPHFAGRVRSLRIFADTAPFLAFTIGMLMNALPKLRNLRGIHCAGNPELISRVVQTVHSYNPRLQRLSLLVTQHVNSIEVPVFNHLTHFAISSLGGSRSSTRMFLAQSCDTLRCLSIKNPLWRFPTKAVSICRLTQIEFNGSLSMDTFSVILDEGHQLESLVLSGILQCIPSPLFRGCHTALPSLRHFSLAIVDLHRHTVDLGLCSAISEFLRERTQLQTYQLNVPSAVASYIGFDASAWGVLSGLSKLSRLSITFPKDLPPALAGWLIPRSVRALTLDLSLLNEPDFTSFMNQLHPSMPPTLHYIDIVGMPSTPRRPARSVVEHGFPSAHVVKVNETIWTVTRSGEDSTFEVEKWPARRTKYHSAEWLESLGCVDAIWKEWTVCDAYE